MPVVGTVAAAFVGQSALAISGIIAAQLTGVTSRGHLALIVLLPVVLSQVGALGLPLAATFEVARAENSTVGVLRTIRRTVMRQMLAVTGLSGVILVALFASESSDLKIAAGISVIAPAAMLVDTYALAFLQGQQRFASFNVWRTAPSLAYAVGAGLLAIVGGGGVVAFSAVWTLALMLSTIGAVWTVHETLRPDGTSPRHSSLQSMKRFGRHAFFGAASPLESYRADQVLVGLFLTAADLGLYVTAVAVTNLPRFVAASIGMVAYPAVASIDSTDLHQVRAALRWTAGATAAAALLAIPIAIVSEPLVRFCLATSSGPRQDQRAFLCSGPCCSERDASSPMGCGERVIPESAPWERS